MKMASIRDVAKKANVGAATVSRVLNNSGYVSEETRQKIEDAMKELNYTPNELARQLFYKKTGIVAVLVPTVGHPFFSDFVDKIEEELYKKGYKTMVCNTIKEENAELDYLDMLNRHIVDGVISGVHTLEEEYRKIKKPIVALDRYFGEEIPVVTSNHTKGGQLAAEILIKNGCKNVLQFRGALKVGSPYHERHQEFERVMRECGVKVTNFELSWNRFEEEYFESVIRNILQENDKYDGVFGVDVAAILYMNEAKKRGMKIPDDVRIVSYDGTVITRLTSPLMTSIVQPVSELASECVRLIDEMINGKKYQNKKIVLDVSIQNGDTTKDC